MLAIITKILLVSSMITIIETCGPGRGIGGPRRLRRLTPLVFKQHVPNVSENTLGAAGLQEGKISRNDTKFRDLVPNYNRDIIFKDEEGTGADRLMTQRCSEKLNMLAVSVMNQWPGVRLRVTEGWDEEDFHYSNSLHYEGRAVDVTTSDRDRSKYGMLARLAVEAGFDWVYYESRSHIHCAVKSDSSQTSHTSGCFASNSTILTSTGEQKLISKLEIGENVLSMDSAGNTIFSEVLMFLDREVNKTREFIKLEVEGGTSITVTPSHLLIVWTPSMQLTHYKFAVHVEEGEYLLVNNRENILEPMKVRQKSIQILTGFFAPLTKEGTIIVDSVAASCYALINSQKIAHWSFMPIRTFNSVYHLFKNSCHHVSKQIGVHWYAKLLYSLKNVFLPSDWIYH